MPWTKMEPMDLKIQLISDWNSGYFTKSDLSQIYGVSRKTVYKWLNRYSEVGPDGLKDLKRAPKSCPHRTSAEIRKRIIEEKLKKRNRGPRKIRARLQRQHPEIQWPAISTIAYWLEKEGLVRKRKKRYRVPPYTEPFNECCEPNAVWSLDYKGQFRTRNNRMCYPVTISDNFSRYLIGCQALKGPRYEPTRQALITAFREYGLPAAIRTDNGTPFASRSIGGLSHLSIWWIRLGIIPERIDKGCPNQNGRHERMHRTLKEDTLNPVSRNLKEQQASFDAFRADYNDHRPHESLEDQYPSDYYCKSNRLYTEHLLTPEYDYGCQVRQVRQNGEIKFKGRMFYLTAMLAKQPVSLEEVADGYWQLNYSFYKLGTLDLRKNRVVSS